jgi:hypothetical protein
MDYEGTYYPRSVGWPLTRGSFPFLSLEKTLKDKKEFEGVNMN